MDNSSIDRIISQMFIEKALRDFYKDEKSCAGWEKSVISQPVAVKNIIDNGAERIAAGLGIGGELSDLSLARIIDHTLLKPDATRKDIENLCGEAKQYSFASVCVNPCWVSFCFELLKDSNVKVCAVIGFPLGATFAEIKRAEAEKSLKEGAQELDMVVNIGKLKSGDYSYVFHDINQVALAAKAKKAVSKVIIESSLLTDEEKVKACLLSKEAGADFVKTSTGFAKGGATVRDIALMRYVVGTAVGVKASGGIRTYEDAQEMIKSGADRIGASASVKIVSGKKESLANIDGY